MRSAGKASSFQEEALFEYHLYTLGHPTDLRDREIKQVSLLEAQGIPVRKKLVVDPLLSVGRYYRAKGRWVSAISSRRSD